MRRSVFVLVTALAIGLAACGGSDEVPPASTGAPSGATGTTGSTECADLTAGDTFTVTISGFAFDPSCLTARAAQSISIVNEDSADHTFTISGTQIDVTVPAGETFNGEPVTGVVEPGTYSFNCRFHPSMTGTITVE